MTPAEDEDRDRLGDFLERLPFWPVAVLSLVWYASLLWLAATGRL